LLRDLRIELAAVLGTYTLSGQYVWMVLHSLKEHSENIVYCGGALGWVQSTEQTDDSEQFEGQKLVPE